MKSIEMSLGQFIHVILRCHLRNSKFLNFPGEHAPGYPSMAGTFCARLLPLQNDDIFNISVSYFGTSAGNLCSYFARRFLLTTHVVIE